MQFNQKYNCFASKKSQICYIFSIFSETFCLFILFKFFIFIHKKVSSTLQLPCPSILRGHSLVNIPSDVLGILICDPARRAFCVIGILQSNFL